jgi:Na+/H+ antiporter NhaD/arsenite permease-like protein
MPGLQPFSFCMFILVDGVAATGWTRVFSGWYQAWVNVSGLAGCCFGIGVIGVILCNVRLCPSLSLLSLP